MVLHGRQASSGHNGHNGHSGRTPPPPPKPKRMQPRMVSWEGGSYEAGGDYGDLQIEVNHLVHIHTFRTGTWMKMSHRNVENILEHLI